MRLFLGMLGNEVAVAYDGLEAVESVARFRPDVVLLDIGLPILNGYEAARKIRQQALGKDVVLIALTGWGQEDDVHSCKEAGFDHHMLKPVHPQLIQELLSTLTPIQADRKGDLEDLLLTFFGAVCRILHVWLDADPCDINALPPWLAVPMPRHRHTKATDPVQSFPSGLPPTPPG
jgi:CheY-like chemotaxis protein